MEKAIWVLTEGGSSRSERKIGFTSEEGAIAYRERVYLATDEVSIGRMEGDPAIPEWHKFEFGRMGEVLYHTAMDDGGDAAGMRYDGRYRQWTYVVIWRGRHADEALREARKAWKAWVESGGWERELEERERLFRKTWED